MLAVDVVCFQICLNFNAYEARAYAAKAREALNALAEHPLGEFVDAVISIARVSSM